MAYPEKVTDLNPNQLVSRPVVYDLLPGLSAEAISVFESFSARPWPTAVRSPLPRLTRLGPPQRELQQGPEGPLALSEINCWAIKENKTLIASDPRCLR